MDWLYDQSHESLLGFMIFGVHILTFIFIGLAFFCAYFISVFISYGLTLLPLFGGSYWYYRKYADKVE